MFLLNKDLSDERLSAKHRVTENRCVIFNFSIYEKDFKLKRRKQSTRTVCNVTDGYVNGLNQGARMSKPMKFLSQNDILLINCNDSNINL